MNEYTFWTLCESCSRESLRVNPAPDGLCHIERRIYPQKVRDEILYQYEGSNPDAGWVIQKHTFWSSDGYDSVMKDDPVIMEEDIGKENIVVSEEGKLIGFLVGEHKVFWIDDFEEGGRFDRITLDYQPDIILEKWCEEQDENGEWSICAKWDEAVPNNGRPKEYTVVYGILTRSFYSRFSS